MLIDPINVLRYFREHIGISLDCTGNGKRDDSYLCRSIAIWLDERTTRITLHMEISKVIRKISMLLIFYIPCSFLLVTVRRTPVCQWLRWFYWRRSYRCWRRWSEYRLSSSNRGIPSSSYWDNPNRKRQPFPSTRRSGPSIGRLCSQKLFRRLQSWTEWENWSELMRCRFDRCCGSSRREPQYERLG